MKRNNYQGGPQNFLSRLNTELSKHNLPPFAVINPNPSLVYLFNKEDILKVGRLDGAIYYKITPKNLYNLIKQRRYGLHKFFGFVKYLPENLISLLNFGLNNYLNRFSKIVQKKSDIIVFQSQLSKRMQEQFVGKWYKEKKYTIILNGVPTDIFNPYADPIWLEGYPKLAITASFRLHKRLQDAIRLVNYIQKEFPKAKLHVFGNMDVLTEECIKTLDLSNTIFHGRIKSEELPRFYVNCDIGLSLTLFDACPNSVAEMMASGLPVIANKESGASELIKIDELLIPEELKLDYYELQTVESLPKINLKKWSEKIEEVLENRKYYSQLMLERVREELDIRIVAKKYADFIKEGYYGK